jgi:hypothetical protein
VTEEGRGEMIIDGEYVMGCLLDERPASYDFTAAEREQIARHISEAAQRLTAVSRASASVTALEPDRNLSVTDTCGFLGVSRKWFLNHWESDLSSFVRRPSPKKFIISWHGLGRYLEGRKR